ncbi:hypothetical protein D6D12_05480 [Aureobasidium pullulans]|uniref:DSC E3 ubiquitin ligase complex subunit 2 n=1 Tax=Aureobasidium pullulans TaxID=5580 RepID=A0AB74JRP7_AURPU|nr:hypothetical protein D6D12_05480 [Aureobasidium pullulans]THX62940.1 hypothetical protein D6D11_02126 [Aureobasidium pullulans]
MLASGFSNAPLSKYLVMAVVAASLLASITDSKHLFWIMVKPHISDYRQLWRCMTWPLLYTNSTEVLFSAMTLYQLRIIERLWGSRKFASFLISTLPYTVLLPPLLLIVVIRPLSLFNINYLPAGPTAIIFALLAQYHAAIPYMYKYQLSASDNSSPSTTSSAINLTSKSTSYLLPLQLALSQLPGSAIVAAVGWLVGYAYRREILPGAATWRIPDWSAGKRERERFEGLRRRMEGEAATASGSTRGEENEGGRRRTIGGQLLDQFRGS